MLYSQHGSMTVAQWGNKNTATVALRKPMSVGVGWSIVFGLVLKLH